ncbi:translocation/assembly module TamB domain-containing protein [Thiomicrospira sp. ALE5]|uniref:translocation/assembly module TamB domain-containing protein n=1 Tax=Thiomicrospira sp. ALE5 TaxID=748650 RepID=UPI0008E0309B|nr:translocation/assembly module TamB domain-containing protein [Thiomicrospira sp. ALE5]SFR52256.1 translocation and assembly module TamB [Thiomicrospira sp. ALE5]
MIINIKKIILRALLALTSFLASVTLILAGLLSLAILWVISHPQAPQTLYNWASESPLLADYWPEGLVIDKLEGPLYQGISLQNLYYPLPSAEHELAGTVAIKQLALKWRPHRLLNKELNIKELLILAPQIAMIEQKPSESATPLDWEELANLAFDTEDVHQLLTPLSRLDWDIKLQQLRVDDLTFQQGEQDWTLDKALVALKWHQQMLTLNQLNLTAYNSQVELHGLLQYHHAQHTRLELQGRLHHWQNFAWLPLELSEQLKGINTRLPAIQLSAQLEAQQQQITAQLALEGPLDFKWQQQLAGNDQNLEWHTQLTINIDQQSPLSDLELPIELQSLTFSSHGQGSWFGQTLEAQQQLSIQSHNLPEIELANRIGLTPNVNQQTEINTQSALTLEDHGTLHQVMLWNLDNKTGHLRINTRDFMIPGTLNSNENDDKQAWKLNLDSGIQLLDWEERSLILDINQLKLEGLAEPLMFSGHALSRLSQPDLYQLDWLTSELRYGDIDGQFKLALSLAKDRSQLILDQLGLYLGDNQLELSARVSDDLTLDLQLNAARLDQFHPDLSGEVQGKVTLHQPARTDDWLKLVDSAQLTQTWLINNLGWQDWQLTEAQFTTDGDLGNLFSHQIELRLAHLAEQTATAPIIEQLSFSRQAINKSTHASQTQNHLVLTQPDLSLTLSLTDHWSEPLNLDALTNWSAWQTSGLQPRFTLDELILTAPVVGTWQLGEPAQGNWQGVQKGLTLSPLCLQQDSMASFCLQSAQQRIQWQAQHLPWQDWLAPFQPDNITLLGEFAIQGRLDWNLTQSQGNQAQTLDWKLHNTLNWPYFFINVQTPEVALPLTVLNWRNELKASPNQLDLTSQAQLNQHGQLDSQISLTKTANQAWSDAGLSGHFLVDIIDLYLAKDWQNIITIHQQNLSFKADLDGTVNAPQLSANLGLALDFDLPLLGLSEQSISIASDITYPIPATEPLLISGRWLQPDNNQLDLAITYDPSLLTQTPDAPSAMAPIFVRLDSDNFQLLNTSLGDINSQIGIRLNYHPNVIQILGGVKLQNTQLNLALETGQSRTAISGDEILLDAQGKPIEVEDTNLPIFLDFTVGFGDNVQIRGLDARVWLGGELNLVQTPQQPELRGFGQVRIERGRLNIDRRNRIEIDPSGFSFNGPLDNPRLDVNLFRVVDQTTARLNITGQATRPQFVFYSTPTQSQARIVNLLIFGRAGDLQNEPNYESQMLTALYKLGLQNNLPILNDLTQGLGIEDIYFDVQDREVSNLILGRAINEQIYINYAHNLSGVGQSAVQLFFNLTPNWLIKSESGELSNAIDLIYRLER